MHLIFSVLLTLCLSITTIIINAQTIGFKAIIIFDSSRNFNNNKELFEPRPIVAFVWYPAMKSNNNPMLFKQLLSHPSLMAFGSQVPVKEEQKFRQTTASYPFLNNYNADTVFNKAINTVTQSVENATAVKGKYPVILFGNGMNAAGWVYFRQCEMLAKHGYVAVVVPSMYQYRDSLPSFDQSGVNAQWQDMLKALEAVQREDFTDITRSGIAAWSVGGISAAILQKKVPDVQAMISLDGGITYEYGKQLLTTSTYFTGKSEVPFYELRGAIHNQVPRSRYYFDSLSAAGRCMLTISNLDHYHFTSIANMLQYLTQNNKDKLGAFEFVNNLMLAFFDVTVKNDAYAVKRLQVYVVNKQFVDKCECRDK